MPEERWIDELDEDDVDEDDVEGQLPDAFPQEPRARAREMLRRRCGAKAGEEDAGAQEVAPRSWDDLDNRISDHDRGVFVVKGPRGRGKSSYLRQLRRQLFYDLVDRGLVETDVMKPNGKLYRDLLDFATPPHEVTPISVLSRPTASVHRPYDDDGLRTQLGGYSLDLTEHDNPRYQLCKLWGRDGGYTPEMCLENLSRAPYLLVDLPDYDPRHPAAMSRDLDQLYELFIRRVEYRMDGRPLPISVLIFSGQSEVMSKVGHMFLGKAHVLELPPWEPDELLEMVPEWREAEIPEELIRQMAASGEPRAFKEALLAHLDGVDGPSVPDQQLRRLFPRSERRVKMAANILYYLQTFGETSQSDLVRLLKEPKDEVSRTLKALAGSDLVAMEWKGTGNYWRLG